MWVPIWECLLPPLFPQQTLGEVEAAPLPAGFLIFKGTSGLVLFLLLELLFQCLIVSHLAELCTSPPQPCS